MGKIDNSLFIIRNFELSLFNNETNAVHTTGEIPDVLII